MSLDIEPQAVIRRAPADPDAPPGDAAAQPGLPDPLNPNSDPPSAEVTVEMVGQVFQIIGGAGTWLTGDDEWLPKDEDEGKWLYPAVAAWCNEHPSRQMVVRKVLEHSAPALVALWVWIRAQMYLPTPYGEGRPFLRGAKVDAARRVERDRGPDRAAGLSGTDGSRPVGGPARPAEQGSGHDAKTHLAHVFAGGRVPSGGGETATSAG